MNNGEERDNKKPINPILPKITNDEIDLEVDDRRDDEIKGDKPPHHGD